MPRCLCYDGRNDAEVYIMVKTCKRLMVLAAVFVLLVACLPTVTAAPATDTLAGKRVLFVGDSIAAGWRDTGYGHKDMTAKGGWSLSMVKDFNMKVSHAAQPGQSITVIPGRGCILPQMRQYKYDPFDYVILQGGFNDCMGENKAGNDNMNAIPALGIVANSFNVSDFDRSTFSGAFEEFLYYATNDYKHMKIGFIITYKTPLSQYGGITNGVRKTNEGYTQQDYINRQKELLTKWGVPYLDLWGGTASDGKKYSGDIIKVNENGVHFPGGNDNIHLNAAGYDASMPYIAQWMTGLETWTKVPETTTRVIPTIADKPTTTKAKDQPTTTTTTAPVQSPLDGDTTTTEGITTTTGTRAPTKPAATVTATRPVEETETEEAPEESNTMVYVILAVVVGCVILTAVIVILVLLKQKKKS